jgi:hypothetical protein
MALNATDADKLDDLMVKASSNKIKDDFLKGADPRLVSTILTAVICQFDSALWGSILE